MADQMQLLHSSWAAVHIADFAYAAVIGAIPTSIKMNNGIELVVLLVTGEKSVCHLTPR